MYKYLIAFFILISSSLLSEIVELIDIEFVTPVLDQQDTLPILQSMKTQTGKHFSHTDFDEDLKALAKEYNTVEPHIEYVNEKVFIVIRVSHFPLIRSISWEGNQLIQTKTLRKKLTYYRGNLFKPTEFNNAFNQLRSYYLEKGYFQSNLYYEANHDPLTNEIDLKIIIDEGQTGKVRRIRFQGICRQDAEKLSEIMVNKKFQPFFSLLSKQGMYNEEMIEFDEHLITQYFQNQGYADAKASIATRELPENNRLELIVSVERGELYSFGEVTFEGNSHFSDAVITKNMLISSNSIFCPAALHGTVDRINSLYGNVGYIDAYTSLEPRLREGENVYDIHFQINEGEAHFIGLIRINGNCNTEARVILNESCLVPGELFNLSKLEMTERNLRALRFFSEVNVYAVPAEPDSPLPSCYKNVYIDVKEQNTGSAGVSAGMSNSSDVFVNFNVTETNFNYRGISRLFSEGYSALRGAGELAQVNIAVGSGNRTYSLGWSKPHFRDGQWTVGFLADTSNNHYISESYDINSRGIRLFAAHKLSPCMEVGTYYRLRHSDVTVDWAYIKDQFEKAEDAKQAEDDTYEIKPFVQSERLLLLERSDGIVSAAGINFAYDSTDSYYRPTCGRRHITTLEGAGIWGDHNFVKFLCLNSIYQPLGKKSTLKFRADFQFIRPLDPKEFKFVPIDERFFLGGINLIRGYRAYQLGPTFSGEIDDDPSGGASLQLFSLEYNRYLNPLMEAFAFWDAGALTQKIWAFSRFYQSVGVGMRLYLMGPTAPLAIGWGVPLTKTDPSNKKSFFINIGTTF